MKHIRHIQILALLLLSISVNVLSQDCEYHHKEGDCRYDLQKSHKIYSQSKSISLSPLDTIELNMVFYGQKDYILSFCTHKKMYPIHFVLIDQQTKQVLYDNEEDKYLESLGLGFDVTKSLIIRVDVLARESSEEEIKGNIGCLGLLIQYKNYSKKKVQLQM
ncbi:MAG: hypothetical protein KAR19_17100 [Bacteroidales bacterium]|nr:hypothetical protein [Bacteroidales bacterium]